MRVAEQKMKLKLKQQKDKKMDKLRMIGKHNFQMDNFLESDEDTDNKAYESMIDHDAIKEYSSFAQDRFQHNQTKNGISKDNGLP